MDDIISEEGKENIRENFQSDCIDVHIHIHIVVFILL